jgi:hypothetical protein
VTEPAPHRPPAAPAAAPASQQAVTALTRGSLWMIAARWAMRLIGLVSTMILARLLAPEDFGLIALALLAYGLLETLSYAGVDLALMRQGNDSREHYDTAWTIQVLQGVFIAVCLAVGGGGGGRPLDAPRGRCRRGWSRCRTSAWSRSARSSTSRRSSASR